MNEIGYDIKSLRLKMKMTQKELCEACFDIPLRTIQDWESGKRTPPPYVVKLISARLNQLDFYGKHDEK